MAKAKKKRRLVLVSSLIIILLAILFYFSGYAVLTKFTEPFSGFLYENVFWAILFLMVVLAALAILGHGLHKRREARRKARLVLKTPKKLSRRKIVSKNKIRKEKEKKRVVKRKMTEKERLINEIENRRKRVKAYLKRQKKYRV